MIMKEEFCIAEFVGDDFALKTQYDGPLEIVNKEINFD
jgi:hypothetical protein